VLMAFKYGKPRGTFAILLLVHETSCYCAIARDREIRSRT